MVLASKQGWRKLTNIQVHSDYSNEWLSQLAKQRKDSLKRLTLGDENLSTKIESFESLSQCQQLQYFRCDLAFGDFHILPKLPKLTTLEINNLR